MGKHSHSGHNRFGQNTIFPFLCPVIMYSGNSDTCLVLALKSLVTVDS